MTSLPERTTPGSSLDLDAAVRVLRQRGQRITPLKRAVLEQFAGSDCAFTVDELGTRLGSPSDLSPLYRCLASLEQAGILTHLYLDDGCRRYDLSDTFGRHHHHMVCERCEAVLRVEGCVLVPDAANLLEAGGLLLRDHDVTLHGLCAACRGLDDRPTDVPGAEA